MWKRYWSAYRRFLTWSVDYYCKFPIVSDQCAPSRSECKESHAYHPRHTDKPDPKGLAHKKLQTLQYIDSNQTMLQTGKSMIKKQTCPYQSSVHTSESVLLPFMRHTRHVPTSSAVHPPPHIPESSPGQTVPCLYRSILIHSTLRWTRWNFFIFFYQWTWERKETKRTRQFFIVCQLCI